MTTETPKQVHPNTLKALADNRAATQWQPGESGNPKGLSITTRARMAIDKDETCPYDAKGRPWSEALPDALLRQALTKVEGMTHLLDRIEGPVNKAGPVRDINVVFMIGKGYSQPDIVINPPGG